MQPLSISDIKEWSTEQLIQHLQAKFPDDISVTALNILEEQEIRGHAFLALTKKDLMADGMKGGPAAVIAGYVNELKGVFFFSIYCYFATHLNGLSFSLYFFYVCLLTYTLIHRHQSLPRIRERP